MTASVIQRPPACPQIGKWYNSTFREGLKDFGVNHSIGDGMIGIGLRWVPPQPPDAGRVGLDADQICIHNGSGT